MNHENRIPSVFDWRRQPAQIDTRDLVVSSTLRAASTRKVQENRANGVDQSTIRGLSRKSDALALSREVLRDRHGGAYGKAVAQPESRTGKMREALKSGPKSGAELAIVAGVVPTVVSALLKWDISKGRITKLRDCSPMRYALVEGAS